MDNKQKNVKVQSYSPVKEYLRYYELHSIGNSCQVDAISHVQLQLDVEAEETPDRDILDLGAEITKIIIKFKYHNAARRKG